jgi:hypothetical protein
VAAAGGEAMGTIHAGNKYAILARTLGVAVFACAAVWTCRAAAEPVLFSFTSTDGATAQFALPRDATPDISSDGFLAVFSNVNGTYGGAPITFEAVNFRSFSSPAPTSVSNGGFGLYLTSSQFNVSTGPQLYSGSEIAPHFLDGVYSVTDYYTSAPGTLTLSSYAGPGFPPGAPGPQIGLGLAPALIALAGLAMTRMRRSRA